MGSLVDLAKQIQSQLANADREPIWEPHEADRYMAEVAERRERFEKSAARLNDTTIQPRLETLAGYLQGTMMSDELPGHCTCWVGYSERFPASCKVSFAVEHDARFEKTVVRYKASMVPVFIKFSECDNLTLSLDDVNDGMVADWVEFRLLEFLDAYLRIDRGGDDFEDEVVTDPICGMRIRRSNAAASDGYRGQPYFFCSTDCLAEFARDPTAYVQVKML